MGALLSLVAGVALAVQPLDAVRHAAADMEDLTLAQQLVDAERYVAAEALARRVAVEGTPDLRARAEAILAQIPSNPPLATNKAILAGWHSMLGAWTLGPGVALSTRRWVAPGVQVGGLALGTALGMSSSLVYTRWVEPTTSRTLLILGTEQIVMWHSAALSMLVDPRGNDVPAALQVGAVVGMLGGGALAIYADVPPGPTLAAYSGALWGVGLTAAWMAIPGWEGEVDRAVLTLLVGSDLGLLALGGLGLGLDMSLAEAGLMDLGGIIGGVAAGTGVGLYTLFLEQPWEYPEEAGLAWVTVGIAAGAVAGLVVGRRSRGSDLWIEVEPAPVLLPGPDGKVHGGMGLTGRF